MARAQALVAAVAIIAGALLLACGGGGDDSGLPIDEYFLQLVKVDEDTGQASDTLQEQFEAALTQAANEQEGLELYRQHTAAQLANYESFVDQFEELDPPSTIRSEHNEGIADLRDYIAVFRGIQEEMFGITSLEELQPLFRRDEFVQADERAVAFCAELEELAGEAGIEITLNCSGG